MPREPRRGCSICDSVSRNSLVCPGCINNTLLFERRKVLAELTTRRDAALVRLNELLEGRVGGLRPSSRFWAGDVWRSSGLCSASRTDLRQQPVRWKAEGCQALKSVQLPRPERTRAARVQRPAHCTAPRRAHYTRFIMLQLCGAPSVVASAGACAWACVHGHLYSTLCALRLCCADRPRGAAGKAPAGRGGSTGGEAASAGRGAGAASRCEMGLQGVGRRRTAYRPEGLAHTLDLQAPAVPLRHANKHPVAHPTSPGKHVHCARSQG